MDANIPGYAVIKRMGEGGMATVYLAYQQNLERRVALKVLHPALAENPEYCTRFLREAKIGASLCHRNIVPVYEVGRFRNYHYLTMEYLPNGDLKRRLARGCDTRTVLRVVYDIAAALGYAHSKAYIHRDIKPENIMFREDHTAVLTDFGIAVDVSDGNGATTPRQIAGSPQYMSPEHAKAGRLDLRSDIYSLGAVLYEALAGHPLLEPTATLADVIRQIDDPLPRLPSEVSWVQPVLDRMLAKNPKDRFNNMGEVMHALEPCLQASRALARGAQRRPPVAEEPAQHQPVIEEPAAPQRAAEPPQHHQPRPAEFTQRQPARQAFDHHEQETDDFGAHRRALEELIYRDREREPVLSPSAPTLVVNASDDLAAALASCPPIMSPSSGRASKPRQRSRAGILLVVLGLAAVPLVLTQWPDLQHDIAQLIDSPEQGESVRTAQLSDMFEQQPSEPPLLPSEPPGAIPDRAPPTTLSDEAPESLSSAEIEEAATRLAADIAATPEPLEPPPTAADSVDDSVADVATAEPAPPTEEDLLQQAGDALEATPPTQENLDNAYDKFREVLANSPSNQDAREGLANVARRYLDMASIALNQDELKLAQEYVDLASKITSRHSLGSHLRDKIADMQYVLNRLYQLQTQPAAEPYREAQVNWNQ